MAIEISNIPLVQDGVDTYPADWFNNVPRQLNACLMQNGQPAIPASTGSTAIGANNELAFRLDNLILARKNVFTCTGSSNAYILTTNPSYRTNGIGFYAYGQELAFVANHSNTGASTVNVDAWGLKDIKQEDGSALSSGMIVIGKRYNIVYQGTYFILINPSSSNVYVPSQITIANNISDANNDIDISAGNFVFSDKTGWASASAMTKRLDANWSAGTNQGGLDTGTKQPNTKYNVFKIYNPTTNAEDTILSLGAYNVGPALPSGYTKFTYINTIFTDGSGNIIPFTQSGRLTEFASAITEFTSITTSYQNASITIPAVPCIARMSYRTNVGGNDSITVVVKSNLSGVETNLGSISYTSQNGGGAFTVSSNDGKIQRKYLQSGSSTPSGFQMYLQGYELLV